MLEQTFQKSVVRWLRACLGDKSAFNKKERNFRFLEEALKLVQSLELSEEEALRVVKYVYARPVGYPRSEVGGVMVTLAALCEANMLNLEEASNAELERIWNKMPEIQEKQRDKVAVTGMRT